MNNKTILLVDDDTDVLNAIEARCRSIGLDVQTARNLLTANTKLEKDLPDAICVDVQMPSGNGLRWCETLLTDPATQAIPLIVFTGQRDTETLNECRRLKAHYVGKRPDVWSELEPLIRRLTNTGDFGDQSAVDVPQIAG